MLRQKERTASQPRITFGAIRALPPYRLAEILSRDRAEALPWISAAARYGLTEAQLLLGQLLLDGRSTPRDPAAAIRWFTAAAAAGDASAVNMLGRCHELGWGTPVNANEAAAWYRRAAEQGLDWAQYNLANLLLRGRGIVQDRRQAFAWYLLAARQGHAKSINLIGRFYEEGWDIPANPTLAYHCYRLAAEGGDFRARFNFGTLLVKQSRITEAAECFHAALQDATPDVIQLLAGILLQSPHPTLREVAHAALYRRAPATG